MKLSLLVIILSIVTSKAEDITTLKGVIYKGATVSKVSPDGISLITDSGVEKIPFTDLSSEIQNKYGYTPEKAAAYQTTVSKAAKHSQHAATVTKDNQALWQTWDEKAKALHWKADTSSNPEDRTTAKDFQVVLDGFKKIVAAMEMEGQSREKTTALIRSVEDGKIFIGMPNFCVLLAWGRPEKINSTLESTGKSEQWCYPDGRYVFVRNNFVTSIHDFNSGGADLPDPAGDIIVSPNAVGGFNVRQNPRGVSHRQSIGGGY